jgi:hypothetical protein
MRRIWQNSFTPLIVLTLVATMVRCMAVMRRAPFDPRSDYVTTLCWALPVLVWMDYDVIRRHRRPCYDFGLFLTMTFPFSVLWYCFWSRGRRGLRLLLGLACLLYVPFLVGAILEEIAKG